MEEETSVELYGASPMSSAMYGAGGQGQESMSTAKISQLTAHPPSGYGHA